MSYMRAGDYYRGDYYRAGGIFDVIGGALKGIGSVASVIPGIGGLTGSVLKVAGGLMSSSSGGARGPANPAGIQPRLTAAPPKGRKDEPGITGVVHRLIPGGRSGYLKAHRTMRVTNPKALKRAERRLRGFEKMAKRALRPLGLHVVRHTCQHVSHKGRR